MTDLRILVAKALNSADLEQSDIRETNIDRIGALAFADPLGGALWALKWAWTPQAYPKALALLTHRSKRVCGDFSMRSKLCRTALLEWLDDLCHICAGRGFIPATAVAPRQDCEICHGSGKRRLSEVWRMRELRMERDVYRKWQPRFAAVQKQIIYAEDAAWYDIARQLGRI